MREWVIYTLSDPRTDEVRYVGVTHGRTRLSEHISKSRSKRDQTRKGTWVRSLLREGVRPKLTVIDRGIGDWASREKHWISEYRLRVGFRLTNLTHGGEGTLGWKPSTAQRARIAEATRKAHTGMKRSATARANMSDAQRRISSSSTGVPRIRSPHRPETRAKISQSLSGKKASLETRAKLSQAHKNPSPETREKLKKAILRRSVDVRAAFASNQKGKPKSDETRKKMSDARKAYWERKKANG